MKTNNTMIENEISKETAQALIEDLESKLPMAKKGIKYSLIQLLGAFVASAPFVTLALYFKENLNSQIGMFLFSLVMLIIFLVSAVWVLKNTIGFKGVYETAREAGRRAKDRCRWYPLDLFLGFCEFCTTYLWCIFFPIFVTIKRYFYLKCDIRLLEEYAR